MGEINKRGVMKTNLFNVMIAMPTCMKKITRSKDRQEVLSLRCSGASIPGVGIRGTNLQRQGYGLQEMVATEAILTDVNLEFILDQKLVADFFEEWTLGIVDYSRLKSMSYVTSTSNDGMLSSGRKPYFANYKDNYSTTILINIFDEAAERIKTVELTEAFPVRLSSIDLNWNDRDKLAKLVVTFNYRDIIYHYLDSDNFRIESKYDRILNDIDLVANIFNTASGFITAVKPPKI